VVCYSKQIDVKVVDCVASSNVTYLSKYYGLVFSHSVLNQPCGHCLLSDALLYAICKEKNEVVPSFDNLRII
jgi:hypothetical protein